MTITITQNNDYDYIYFASKNLSLLNTYWKNKHCDYQASLFKCNIIFLLRYIITVTIYPLPSFMADDFSAPTIAILASSYASMSYRRMAMAADSNVEYRIAK